MIVNRNRIDVLEKMGQAVRKRLNTITVLIKKIFIITKMTIAQCNGHLCLTVI